MIVYSKERGLRKLKDENLFNDYRKKFPTAIKIKKVPSIKTLEKWEYNGICKTPDGCKVEPDGECSHGYPSWLLILGYI